MANQQQVTKQSRNIIDALQKVLTIPRVKSQFENALGKHQDVFFASLIDIVSGDTKLQLCEPAAIIREALRAALLKLPLNKSLGFAYILPFKNGKLSKRLGYDVYEPTFIPGYKGDVQLVQRTSMLKKINMGCLYEGQTVKEDLLSGDLTFGGEAKSEKETHYFAYFELTNGFSKAECWSKEKVIKHAQRYSPGYRAKVDSWVNNFKEMACKTVLNHILDIYAPKSVDFLFSQEAPILLGKEENPFDGDDNGNQNDDSTPPNQEPNQEQNQEQTGQTQEDAQNVENRKPGFGQTVNQ